MENKKFYIAELEIDTIIDSDYSNRQVEKHVVALFDDFEDAKRYARDFYEGKDDDYPSSYDNEEITITENKYGNNTICAYHSYEYEEMNKNKRIVEQISIQTFEIRKGANPYNDIMEIYVG